MKTHKQLGHAEPAASFQRCDHWPANTRHTSGERNGRYKLRRQKRWGGENSGLWKPLKFPLSLHTWLSILHSSSHSVTCLLIHSELILQWFCVSTGSCREGYHKWPKEKQETGMVVHICEPNLGGGRFWSLDYLIRPQLNNKTKQ